MYILEFKRNLLIFDYEWIVYVKLYEKSFIVYLFLMIELCFCLVIILKIKKKEYYKNMNIFGIVDEGCCVKFLWVIYFC